MRLEKPEGKIGETGTKTKHEEVNLSVDLSSEPATRTGNYNQDTTIATLLFVVVLLLVLYETLV